MTTYSKVALSGSTNGKAIAVAATSIGSGTTIHQVANQTSTPGDLVTLYAVNINTTPETLVVNWGEASPTSANTLTITLGVNVGPVLVTSDWPLNNNLTITAATTTASKVLIYGSANRLT